MKIKIFTSVLTLSLLIGSQSFSQFNCGTAEYHKAAKAKYPNIQENEDLFMDLLRNNNANRSASDPNRVYIIPIVFHILHNYGPENISDAQILDAVNILNEDYRKLNSDIAQVIPPYQPLIADCKIEFRLAKLDPAGNCTNGIDRIATTKTYQSDDEAKLNLWDPRRYLNVWVANTIGAEGVAGYSNYPSTVNNNPLSEKDGVLILHDYIGSIGTSSVNSSRALTHEIGHYLSLPHPWGDTNSPEVACGDDGVPDTPETKGHLSCSNRYDYTCSIQTLESNTIGAVYLFNNVTSSTGTVDSLGRPNVQGIDYSVFKANGVSSSTTEDGKFAFSNWPLSPSGFLYTTDTVITADTVSVLGPNNTPIDTLITFVLDSIFTPTDTIFAYFPDTSYTISDTVYTQVVVDTVFTNGGVINTNKYYEFKVKPNLPYAMKITGMSFTVGRNANGARTFAIRSSADNFANNLTPVLGSSDTVNMQILPGNIVLLKKDTASTFNFSRLSTTGAPFSLLKDTNSITYRIYAWNAEESNGSFIVDNLKLIGDFGEIENVENYMDYSYCSKMFTLAQANQMRNALVGSLAQRNVLWSDTNLVSTGVNLSNTVCAPKADFTVTRRYSCVGKNVTFKDESSNGEVTSYSWSFPGATPSSSTLANPVVVYSTPGWKDVTLTVSNSAGSSTITKTAINIGLNEPQLYAPYTATSFSEPFTADDSFDKWIVYNPENNGSHFRRVKLTDGSENYCVVLENFGQGKDKDILISPSYDFKFRSNVKLNFRISGSTTQSIVNADDLALILDSLRIYFSKDCGDTWSYITAGGGSGFFSVDKSKLITGGPWNIPYNASNTVGWVPISVNLPSSPSNALNMYDSNVRVMFRFTAGGRNTNNVYIDDINFTFDATNGLKDEEIRNMTLFPNPYYSSAEGLSISTDLGLDNATIEITDALGRLVSSEKMNLQSGSNNTLNTSTLNAQSKGIYFIRVTKNSEAKATFKFIKNF